MLVFKFASTGSSLAGLVHLGFVAPLSLRFVPLNLVFHVSLTSRSLCHLVNGVAVHFHAFFSHDWLGLWTKFSRYAIQPVFGNLNVSHKGEFL